MKRLVVLAVLACAGPLHGQTLPSPQFATPAANDSSARAATTAWVRSLNLLTATSDLSQATVKAAGAAVARTEAARAADVFNVLDYGAVADGATDIGPALNAIAAKLGAGATSNVIYFPNGVYRLASAVTFAGTAPILTGQGFSQGPGAVGSGTWIKIDQTGFTPITFSGTNARGAKVRDLAFFQIHPAPAAGWIPTAYDYVFRIQNALGEVAFDNVLFAGVNRGIYADNSGRLNIRDVQGQFYTAGVEIDDCYDIPRIQRLHSWTFATSSPYVVSYQEANADTVLLRRVDGIFIGDLFTLGMRTALHLTSGANGVTTKAYVSNLYADFVNYGVLIDGPGSDIQIANLTSQNNDQTNSGTTLPNGNAVWINTTGVTAQIANLYSKLTAGPAVEVDGNSNRVNIANLRANTFGTPGAGTAAVFVTDSGTNPSNQVYVGNKEQLQGTAPLVLFNTGTNGGRERFVMMNDAGGANPNEARGYSAGPGGAPQIAAIGGDTNIDLYLNGKGTSGVRLQSSGQTVLRADNPNGSTDDVLLRGGAGTLNWIAEGGDANVDLYLTPKGTSGGVRLQGNGSTVLRVDNPNSIADDLLFRATTGALNLIAEGSDTNVDIVVSPKGATGGVRLQSNGNTVLRVSNTSSSDTSDLLAKSGVGTVALIAEDPTANANIVINPKGIGLVSTGNCPAGSDNSSNLACTSWVKGQGYALTSALGPLATQPALVSATVAGTGSGGLLVAAPTQGNGSKVQLSSGTTTTNDCVKFDANGNTVDAGGACGTGGGGITALTGDVSASGAGSVAATLASVGTAGTYSKVTTDAKGRVTSGAAIASSDVTGALGYTPLPTASPSATGTLTMANTNSLALTGASSGSAPGIAALGGDASVDLTLAAAGATGSTRLQANGGTVFRADNPGGGNSDVLVRSGTGVVSLTVESGSTAANLSLLPKATGVVTAPTAAASDNSTTIATTAFVKSLGYAPSASPALTGTATVAATNSLALSGAASGAAPSIAATGGDAAVDLALTGAGTGSVRLKANGVTVLRTDSPGPGTSDVLVRSGSGTVSFTAEDGGSNASLSFNPKGSGTVAVPTPASSSNTNTAATTAFVRAVLPCVQPQAGRAYMPPAATLSTATLTNSAGTQAVYAVPLIVCGARAVTALAFEITTATSTAFSARLAIYADSGGLPGGAPLADTGTLAIAASSTGVQIGAISGGPTLAPGIYWLTLQTSYVAAPATVKALSTGGLGGVGQALGYSLTAGAASAGPTGLYQNGTFGAPPNPFGTPTGTVSGNAPVVWVQF